MPVRLKRTLLCNMIMKKIPFSCYLKKYRCHFYTLKKSVKRGLHHCCVLFVLCVERESCSRVHFSFPNGSWSQGSKTLFSMFNRQLWLIAFINKSNQCFLLVEQIPTKTITEYNFCRLLIKVDGLRVYINKIRLVCQLWIGISDVKVWKRNSLWSWTARFISAIHF